MRKPLIGEFTENLYHEDTKMGGLLATPYNIRTGKRAFAEIGQILVLWDG